MAVKINGKLRGESAAEQYALERKRFLMRQRRRPVLAERIKSREEKQLEDQKFESDQKVHLCDVV